MCVDQPSDVSSNMFLPFLTTQIVSSNVHIAIRFTTKNVSSTIPIYLPLLKPHRMCGETLSNRA